MMKRPAPAPAELPLLDQLVRDAFAKDSELRALDTLAGRKLSAKAFFREQLAVAGSTPERISKLRDDIAAGETHGVFDVRSVLRRMIAFARSPNVPGVCRDARRLRHMMTDYASAELSLLGASSLELFALAVQIAGEKHPEAFGTVESTEDLQRRMQQLKAERDELYQRISTEFKPEDLAYSELDASGRARVSFKMTAHAVPLYPVETAGERLVGWLARQQPAKESD